MVVQICNENEISPLPLSTIPLGTWFRINQELFIVSSMQTVLQDETIIVCWNVNNSAMAEFSSKVLVTPIDVKISIGTYSGQNVPVLSRAVAQPETSEVVNKIQEAMSRIFGSPDMGEENEDGEEKESPGFNPAELEKLGTNPPVVLNKVPNHFPFKHENKIWIKKSRLISDPTHFICFSPLGKEEIYLHGDVKVEPLKLPPGMMVGS